MALRGRPRSWRGARPLVADGRLEPFKTATEFEGAHHKRQHQAGTPASR